MPLFETNIELLRPPNGDFLVNTQPVAATTSLLAHSVKAATDQYFGKNQLGSALLLIKNEHITVLTDYWHNGALDALASAPTANGFNDSTSSGETRTSADYLTKSAASIAVASSVNQDPYERFGDNRLIGFEISNDQQPVMALVVLDPGKLDPRITPETKSLLLDEIRLLRLEATASDEATRSAAASKISNQLRNVLSSTLLANDTYVQTDDPWPLPFDTIASLKALYTLLSGERSSASMRQGAVRLESETGLSIIVGASGLNSAIDEMVARNFAHDVLTQP